MSPMAADSLAETRARRRLGIAMAAMIPMMATTIRSSMRVKPAVLASADFLLIVPSSRRRNRGGAEAPPQLKQWLLEDVAGGGRDRDLAVAVVRLDAGRREADDAARVARKAAHAGLPDVQRGGGVHVRGDARGVSQARDRSGLGPEARNVARVAGLGGARRELAVDERGAVGRVVRDAARGRSDEAGPVTGVEARVRRLIRRLGRNHGADVADRRRLVRGDPRPEEAGDRDRGDDADDRDDDQQLDQGETLLVLH